MLPRVGASAAPQANGHAAKTVVAAPAAVAAPATGNRSLELETFLVDFVVEQTGYPREIVELDADLEADLGIDSIRKAQLFGEIGQKYSLMTASRSTSSPRCGTSSTTCSRASAQALRRPRWRPQ
jgi:hypothetical protein